ncbi:MAG: NAD-glutamate dehydrogenase domain-containing protein, partial [Myxococcota bacterium]|nr:NAD-glutamate dehydrogenase domain-containing protein [Myxococcota bacterium]
MSTSYTHKMLRSVTSMKNDLYKSFLNCAGLQLRAPTRARHSPENCASLLLASYELLLKHTSKEISIEITQTDRGYVFQTVMDDQPFIVDTIRMHLQSMGASSISGYNLVVRVERDDTGKVNKIHSPMTYSDSLVSVIRFEVEGTLGISKEDIHQKMSNSLTLAHYMVQDFKAMTDTIEQVINRFRRKADRNPDQLEEYEESAAFLSWLLQDNFVFMGLSFEDARFGFAQKDISNIWDYSDLLKWEPDLSDFPITTRKGNMESPIHRLGQVDELYIRVPSDHGSSTAVLRVQGLFTHRAVTQSSRSVPLLRKTLRKLLREDGCQGGTYRYKGICNVFDSLPTEFLFTSDLKQLGITIDSVLESEQEQVARANIVQSGRTDTVFVITAMPRGHWTETLGGTIESILRETTGASYCDNGMFVGRYNTILLHFFLTGTRRISEEEKSEIEQRLVNLSTPWHTRLYHALVAQISQRGSEIAKAEEKASSLLSLYHKAFQGEFQQRRPIDEAAQDILNLELTRENQRPIVKIFALPERNRSYLRVYQTRNLLLSDMLPVIDDFGLRVVDQFADPVYLPTGSSLTIDTFRLEDIDNLSNGELTKYSSLICGGIEAVFNKKTASDSMNRLLIAGKIPWKAVDMFRALHNYARQLAFPFSIEQTQTILCSSVENVKLLWNFFEQKFNPSLQQDDGISVEKAMADSRDEIRKLRSQQQDIVFRTYHNLIESILRTNFYRTDKLDHYLSFKFECAKVQNMPSPRMMVEIYVHHRAMEGIHLRGGKIARGGIRWSDRFDFRKEILDLVSTQMVKNVLIVPEGAKGGFRIKEEIADRSERRRRADELYQILVRGLLDVTDNRVGSEIVPPPQVVSYDNPDPYLVVAADKGTAHLSDTANALSQSYNFWLGDAFASGGSNGYDHKKVGITARGAWVTTKRHFHELGLNPETDAFTAIGIGDPAGDVFGNGVVYLDQKTLPNNKMKLIAAFNHMHIFLDPTPNPQTSYEERVRLFRAVKGWGEYKTELLSEG